MYNSEAARSQLFKELKIVLGKMSRIHIFYLLFIEGMQKYILKFSLKNIRLFPILIGFK